MTNCIEIGKQQLHHANIKAIIFLLEARDKEGWWKDFLTPAGVSDAWVTGYVGAILAAITDDSTRTATRNAWQLLLKRNSNSEGWGYSAKVPADADTTLWCLQLATALGEEDSPRLSAGYAFLDRHLKDDGGVTTYFEETPIRKYIGLPKGVISFEGWCSTHICVTAAAACLPKFGEQFLPLLRQEQQADGRWCSYWWFGDEYCTALVATALAKHSQSVDDRQRIEQAVSWGVKRLRELLRSEQPAEFAIAWCFQLLSLTKNLTSVRDICLEGVQYLTNRQRADGSWDTSAKLRVPRPDVFAPESVTNWKQWTGKFSGLPTLENILENTFNLYSLDQNRIFTTATVLQALYRLSELGIGENE